MLEICKHDHWYENKSNGVCRFYLNEAELVMINLENRIKMILYFEKFIDFAENQKHYSII